MSSFNSVNPGSMYFQQPMANQFSESFTTHLGKTQEPQEPQDRSLNDTSEGLQTQKSGLAMSNINNASNSKENQIISNSSMDYPDVVKEEESHSSASKYDLDWNDLSESIKEEYRAECKRVSKEVLGEILQLYYNDERDKALEKLNNLSIMVDNAKRRKYYLMLKQASISVALGQDVEKVQELIHEVAQELIHIEDSQDTADSKRILYLMQTKAFIQKGKLNEAQKVLEDCKNVGQDYFKVNVIEDYMDFYDEYMGLINVRKAMKAVAEGRLDKAEEKFKSSNEFYLEALNKRKLLGNNRLLSFSYISLAQLYVEWARLCKEKESLDKKKKEAYEYLNKAILFYTNFKNRAAGDKDDVNIGIVDYSKPDFEKVKQDLQNL